MVGLLTTILGIGEYSVLAIIAEVGDVARFSDSRNLCAYAGVVPGVRNSTEIVHPGRITEGKQHAATGSGGGDPDACEICNQQ